MASPGRDLNRWFQTQDAAVKQGDVVITFGSFVADSMGIGLGCNRMRATQHRYPSRRCRNANSRVVVEGHTGRNNVNQSESFVTHRCLHERSQLFLEPLNERATKVHPRLMAVCTNQSAGICLPALLLLAP